MEIKLNIASRSFQEKNMAMVRGSRVAHAGHEEIFDGVLVKNRVANYVLQGTPLRSPATLTHGEE